MSFSVYYKFKSQRSESRVTFDGTGISVFDLKKEIILQNNLKASDIDLLLFDSAEQEYKDDHFIIPRSTSVIAKRMPAARPGKGRAQIYVANVGGPGGNNADASSNPTSRNGPPGAGSGGGQFGGGRFQGVMSKRFDGRDSKQPSNAPSSASTPPVHSGQVGTDVQGAGDDEAAQIAAMFAETSEQWEETQEKMAQSVIRRQHGSWIPLINLCCTLLDRELFTIIIPEAEVLVAAGVTLEVVAGVIQINLGPINQIHAPSLPGIYVTAATKKVIGSRIVPQMMTVSLTTGQESRGQRAFRGAF
ncbi:hypothetical protein FRB95_001929 [Tulasnella sp. JGI-2019a]|nr:hypothetical protein FRB95_001929 [Tulasnella sp. JGI-2019a]